MAEAKKRRGRPPGRTAQGEQARERLFRAAVKLIARRGFAATTLRDIADRAGVSVGLLYRYFPSKRAVVIALYDELSADYATRAASMGAGTWSARFVFALGTSLEVLRPHRSTLLGLIPVLIGGSEESVLGAGSQAARRRVQQIFAQAVAGASDAPEPSIAAALGRLLYVVHLAVILFWLLDKSAEQLATGQLLVLLERAAPALGFALRLPGAGEGLQALDALASAALLGDAGSAHAPRRSR